MEVLAALLFYFHEPSIITYSLLFLIQMLILFVHGKRISFLCRGWLTTTFFFRWLGGKNIFSIYWLNRWKEIEGPHNFWENGKCFTYATMVNEICWKLNGISSMDMFCLFHSLLLRQNSIFNIHDIKKWNFLLRFAASEKKKQK